MSFYLGEIKSKHAKLFNSILSSGSVYLKDDRKFITIGESIYLYSTVNRSNKESDVNIEIELETLMIKKIAESIGYKFIDKRKEVNN